jgi:hypothetical protein
VEGKLAQDVRRIEQILDEKSPDYDWGINVSPDFIIENGWFNAGRSFVKAILCLYASRGPRSFKDNATVNISNNWLKQANSKNYHHFFPRAFLAKTHEDEGSINNVVNITIVDDYLNKREIRAKSPSSYMRAFARENDEIVQSMRTHLINDLDEFGVWSNDYNTFLSKRARVISHELKKRIVPRDIDRLGQTSTANDLEDALAAD